VPIFRTSPPRARATLPAPVRARLLRYARAALRAIQPASREAWALMRWLAHHAGPLGLAMPPALIAEWADPDDRKPPNAATWRKLRDLLDTQPALTRAQRPFATLAEALGLDRTEEAILTLAADYRSVATVELLWDEIATHRGARGLLEANTGLFALLLHVTQGEVVARLRADAPLRTAGLLQLDEDRQITLLPRLVRLVAEPAPPPDMRAALLGPEAKARLPFEAFAHLGAEAGRVLALLRGALAERAVGVHVLLHGPPGTGKTAFAAALAAACGVALHEIGTEGEEAEELARAERLAELRLAQRLIAGGPPALLLLDEAEDLFDPGFELFRRTPRPGSRAFIHRMLETAPAPVIWTANELASFGPAVLRRMACCIELRIPPVAVREALWQDAAAREGVALPPGEAAGLARLLPAAPALARSAMRAARLAGGDVETVRWAVQGVARAMEGGRLPPPEGMGEAFDPALVNADCDLPALADRLALPGTTRRVSLLLSGPPGSGKSAYARHLAERMGLPVLVKRASDLLGMYVGQTEQRIAQAFAEARDTGAMLVFDEADSLLAERGLAERSWEVSQVNEMLTWMERHDFPFCCTTNLAERLDAAAMRRFLVKARFGFLAPAQGALAWRRAFGTAPPPGLATLDRLTPADFDLVRRGAALAGHEGDTAALLAALAREQRAKPGATGPIGFLAGGRI
jgi:transitional endoplasmic reticulum ATPase